MSNKRLTAVWDLSKQSGVKLLALLSLADRADDDGYCWPGHESTAKRARSKRTYILAILPEIEADGELYIYSEAGKSHKYLVLPGMTEVEIRKALARRFGYTEEKVEQEVSAILTRQLSGHGVSVQQTSDMSVPLTGGVSGTEHEPTITHKNKPSKKQKKKAAPAAPPPPPVYDLDPLAPATPQSVRMFEVINRDREAKKLNAMKRFSSVQQREQTEIALSRISAAGELEAAFNKAMVNGRHSRDAFCSYMTEWANNLGKSPPSRNGHASPPSNPFLETLKAKQERTHER